jgi:D-threonate/D-erythronate kinase
MPEASIPTATPGIGIIADDLTGAAELAGAAWRFGFRSEIHLHCGGATDAEVVAVDTDSRSCDPAEAARRAEVAALHLSGLGVKWIYKKVDSVLRGNVMAEVEAMVAALLLQRALLVPANPKLGRTVQRGTYLIAGKPIDRTDFRNDPQHPRFSSRVLELLGAPNPPRAVNCRNEEELPPRGIIIGDAASPEDLQGWADKLDTTTLPAGAVEFFVALLRSKHSASFRPHSAPMPASDWRTLFVCGSMTDSTRQFLGDCRRHGWPVFTLPPVLLEARDSADRAVRSWAGEMISAFAQHRRVIAAIDLPPVKGKADRLTELLVAAVKAVASQVPVAQINAEGGATAVALMRAMRWSRLRVLGELSPGVVTLALQQDSPVRLTIKPGSYRWPASLWE